VGDINDVSCYTPLALGGEDFPKPSSCSLLKMTQIMRVGLLWFYHLSVFEPGVKSDVSEVYYGRDYRERS